MQLIKNRETIIYNAQKKIGKNVNNRENKRGGGKKIFTLLSKNSKIKLPKRSEREETT